MGKEEERGRGGGRGGICECVERREGGGVRGKEVGVRGWEWGLAG